MGRESIVADDTYIVSAVAGCLPAHSGLPCVCALTAADLRTAGNKQRKQQISWELPHGFDRVLVRFVICVCRTNLLPQGVSQTWRDSNCWLMQQQQTQI